MTDIVKIEIGKKYKFHLKQHCLEIGYGQLLKCYGKVVSNDTTDSVCVATFYEIVRDNVIKQNLFLHSNGGLWEMEIVGEVVGINQEFTYGYYVYEISMINVHKTIKNT
jgi:hypothetical protein